MHLLRSARKGPPAQPQLPAASIAEEPFEDLADEQHPVAADVAVPGVRAEGEEGAQSPAKVAAAEYSASGAEEDNQAELCPGNSAAAAKVCALTSSGVIVLLLKGLHLRCSCCQRRNSREPPPAEQSCWTWPEERSQRLCSL